MRTNHDDIGRATRMMMKYTPDELESETINGTGAQGDENELNPDDDEAAEDSGEEGPEAAGGEEAAVEVP